MINTINIGLLNSVIVILFLSSIAAISFIYIIPKQKQKPAKRNNVYGKKETGNFTNTIITYPQITVIIADNKDDEQLISEIADMYISERTYFYTGKTVSNANDNQRPEKEIYIEYDSVTWDLLKHITI